MITPAHDRSPPPRAAGVRALAAEVADVVGHPFFQYLAATAAALVILFARAPVAGVMPELFAEDGAWTSSLHTRGFWETVFHGRRGSDYPVFGNVLLLWLGSRWCAIVHGGDLLQLAGDCARVSYLAFAAAISLPVLLLRRQLPGIRLPAVWILACFLPLGLHDRSPSGFEILGRAANGGFLCLFIAFVLAWHRLANVRDRVGALAADVGLLACAATNPLCHAILPVTLWPAVAAARTAPGGRLRLHPADPFFPWGLVAGIVFLVTVGMPAPQAKRLPVTAPPLAPEAIVEIGLARSMLYPVAWPVYRRLSTERTLLLAAVCAAVGWRLAQRRHRAVYLGGVSVMAVASLALVLFRPELGQCLGGYRTTFPDRYFYAQHLVALPLLVLLASDAVERLRGPWRLAPGALLIALGLTAIIREPAWMVPVTPAAGRGRSSFATRMAEALRQERFVDAELRPAADGAFLEVPNPDGRPKRLVVPRESAIRSLDRARRLAGRAPDAAPVPGLLR